MKIGNRNNPLTSVQAHFTADSAPVFTSEAMTTSGWFSWTLPGQMWSSHLRASCVIPDQRSQANGNGFSALTSTLSQIEKNWTNFSLSSFRRLARCTGKDRPCHDNVGLARSRTHNKMGFDAFLAFWCLFLNPLCSCSPDLHLLITKELMTSIWLRHHTGLTVTRVFP